MSKTSLSLATPPSEYTDGATLSYDDHGVYTPQKKSMCSYSAQYMVTAVQGSTLEGSPDSIGGCGGIKRDGDRL